MLYIAEEEYVTKIGGPSGVRVVVHDKNTMPHPDEDGTLAQPGELTSIGVQKVKSCCNFSMIILRGNNLI